MLIPVFGTPSALTAWAVHFANVTVDVLAGEHEYIAAVALSDLRRSWSNRDSRAVVFHSDVPENLISRLFLESRIPLLIAHEDPLETIVYSMAARDIEWRQAVRFVSQSYSTMAELFCAPNSTVVGPDHLQLPLSAFATVFLDAFGIDATELEKRTIIGRMLGNMGWELEETVRQNIGRHIPHASPLPILNKGWSDDERALAAEVIYQYSVVSTGEQIRTLNWPPRILPDWDCLSEGLNGFKDLVGSGRVITAGHALHLPRGKWRVSVQITVQGNYSGNHIECDILLGDVSLGGMFARLPMDGTYGYEIDFEISDAFPPTQFRMVLLEGAIEGQLRIDSVLFESREHIQLHRAKKIRNR